MRLLASLILFAALTGCAAPWVNGDDDGAAATLERDRSLAARPEQLTATSSTEPAPVGSSGVDGESAAPGSANPEQPIASPDDADAAQPSRTLVDLSDSTGDHGLQGPDWADLVDVALVDTGAGDLEATVVMAGGIPTRLEDREAAGIGLDLYLPGGRESDYQIFLEGSVDGWFAYLDAPDGLVQFPGTFQLGGNRFVVTVSWDSLGDRRPGELRVFADWSNADLVAVAVSSEDHAPDSGRAPYG